MLIFRLDRLALFYCPAMALVVRFDFIYSRLPYAVDEYHSIRNEVPALVLVTHDALLMDIALIKSELRCRSSRPVMAGIPLSRRECSARDTG